MSYREQVTAIIAGLTIVVLLFTLPTGGDIFNGASEASTPVVAVSEGGEGVTGSVTVSLEPGTGETFVETSPFIRADTQVSAEIARSVAQEITGKSLRSTDVTYSFDIEGGLVGGRSAGAAMTLATAAALDGEKLPEDIAVTGTIRPDGRVGRVGGVLEKAYTAGENGIDTFYVPEGQGNTTMYRRVIEKNVFYPGVLATQDVEYRPFQMSLENITQEKYGMGVKEAYGVESLYEKVIDQGRE